MLFSLMLSKPSAIQFVQLHAFDITVYERNVESRSLVCFNILSNLSIQLKHFNHKFSVAFLPRNNVNWRKTNKQRKNAAIMVIILSSSPHRWNLIGILLFGSNAAVRLLFVQLDAVFTRVNTDWITVGISSLFTFELTWRFCVAKITHRLRNRDE